MFSLLLQFEDMGLCPQFFLYGFNLTRQYDAITFLSAETVIVCASLSGLFKIHTMYYSLHHSQFCEMLPSLQLPHVNISRTMMANSFYLFTPLIDPMVPHHTCLMNVPPDIGKVAHKAV